MYGEPSESEEVLALYPWSEGACFRCARGGVLTTVVGSLHPPDLPAPFPVRACRPCTVLMEEERREAAARHGLTYIAGPRRPAETAAA